MFDAPRLTLGGLRALLYDTCWGDFCKAGARLHLGLGAAVEFKAKIGYHMKRPAVVIMAQGQYVVIKYIEINEELFKQLASFSTKVDDFVPFGKSFLNIIGNMLGHDRVIPLGEVTEYEDQPNPA